MKKIIQISDLHFGTVEKNIEEGIIEDINIMKPDLLIVSGDLTQRARSGQYKKAAEFLKRLEYQKLIIPGNHDIPLFDIFSRFIFPLTRYKKYITDNLSPLYKDDEIAVLGINTARSLTWKNGRISVEQMQEIKDRLCPIDDEIFKVIVTHHPFIPPPGEPGISLVGRSVKALTYIDKCKIDLLLSGHLHHGYSGDIRPYYPSRKRSIVAVQAGTAISNRIREEPNAYNLIVIEKNSINITVREWNGNAFEKTLTTTYNKVDNEWIRKD